MMCVSISKLCIYSMILITLYSCRVRHTDSVLSYEKLENGKYVIQGALVNGEKTGLWLAYDKDGNVKVAEIYFRGKPHGEYMTLWNDMLVFLKGAQFLGKDEGFFEQYSDNGNISRKGAFKKDKKIGIWEEYTYEGKLNRILEYQKNGEVKVIIDNELELPVPKN